VIWKKEAVNISEDVPALRYRNTDRMNRNSQRFAKCWKTTKMPCRHFSDQTNLCPLGFNRQLALKRQYLTRTRVFLHESRRAKQSLPLGVQIGS
jgi:hypothetical protein